MCLSLALSDSSKLCVLEQEYHRSGVRWPLGTHVTSIPWSRSLLIFSIVTVPWFPSGIKKQTQVFEKEVQVWSSLFRKHTLMGWWHARLSLGLLFGWGFGQRSSGFGQCSTEQPSVSPHEDKEFGAWILAIGRECHVLFTSLRSPRGVPPAATSAPWGWPLPAEAATGYGKCAGNILQRRVVSVPFKNLCYFPP